MQKGKIKNWLVSRGALLFSVYAIVASFCTYACMYAFRRPFAVANFEGLEFFGIDYKTSLVIAQVFGYMLSKFLGIKIISEMKPNRRAVSILILIGIAEAALILFSIIPAPYNIVCLFVNGLPLGMVWGIVFSFLEGRRLTEVLGAGLCTSFILASGFVKSIGKMVIGWGFSEFQMPFVTGALFLIPLVFFVWMLNQLPPPSDTDVALRTKRIPMSRQDRIQFFTKFAAGIILLTVFYMFLTAYRDIRDNFVSDIWKELGYTNTPMIFTYTEIPVAIGVLVILGSIMWIKSNLRALIINHYIIISGIVLIGACTFCYEQNIISAPVWMTLTGLGVYMGYIPFNCILFERLIATYKMEANSGFLIYIADSFGYLASVGVMLFKNFGQPDISWLKFIINSGYIMLAIGGVLAVLSLIYFKRKSYDKIIPEAVVENA